jgi:hypothetical protein
MGPWEVSHFQFGSLWHLGQVPLSSEDGFVRPRVNR